ncbi:anti-sigma factor [Micromonospora sp. WMMD712]|uniref:anti-sigma factor n=1 Tax=Micromonospora sp. WMMD712 TaxID=3016096 RepID=UPI00249A37CE|nr:anti-sigma factor [Micromonospora sp. WMMD712]WFE60385.1 anti-sigma factor [Micromonospora sp. WMMD712]
MQHLDHDRLVFLALGESEADDGEARHLDACAHCRAEVNGLRHVAGLGAGTQGLGDLPDPPEHVWQGIVAQVAAAEALPSLGDRRAAGVSAAAPTPGGGAGAESGASRPGRAGGRRRRLPRWAVTAVTAAAAAAVGVAGTFAVLSGRADEPRAPERVVLASGSLTAYGTTPRDANGDARVFTDNQLHLHVANLPAVPGYYEVWLIDPATMRMFSVGVLNSGTGDALLPLPPNVDLRTYSVVDVSAEQYDNKPAHSGDSLLRGTLTG